MLFVQITTSQIVYFNQYNVREFKDVRLVSKITYHLNLKLIMNDHLMCSGTGGYYSLVGTNF